MDQIDGMTGNLDATNRFSGRVEEYIRSRPRYPDSVVELLARETGLTPDALIADVGSGTGFSAEPFLRNGNRVIGIEPNGPMRQAGDDMLRDYPHFHGLAGTAEAMTLPTASVDYIVCGQAMHWFEPERAGREFRRVLKPAGWVVLMWHTRRLGSPFMAAYEALLERFGTDYAEVSRRGSGLLHRLGDDVPPQILAFYGGPVRLRLLPTEQRFDFPGLRSRVLSASYMPAEGHPSHGPMLQRLWLLFDEHQQGGEVVFEYDLEVYFGRLA